MINPLRSEAEAYRFLLLTVGYFAVIALAALAIGTWAGIIVFLGLTLAGVVYVARARRVEVPRQAVPSRRGRANERRILVIANETVGGERLRNEIHTRSEGYDAHVLVVTPALNSHLRHWASDEDNARLDAEASRSEPGSSPGRGHRREGRGGRRGAGAGDGGCAPALRRGRDHHLDAPQGRSHWLEKGSSKRPRTLRGPDHARGRRPPSGTRRVKSRPSNTVTSRSGRGYFAA